MVSGSNATFTITVTNDGDVALSNVMVTDPLAPDCDLTLASLPAGGSTSYVCTVTNVVAVFVIAVTFLPILIAYYLTRNGEGVSGTGK